jgi:hypothetical protein
MATDYPHAHDVLFAFYDLEVAPVTFDFLWFILSQAASLTGNAEFSV